MRGMGALALSLLVATGCSATAPTSLAPATPAPAKPALIPLNVFFASSENTWGYRISPDGTRLAWIASYQGRATVHVRTLGADDARPIITNPSRTLRTFVWARDSRAILYHEDAQGDENFHILRVSAASPDEPPVDLTPVAGSRAWIVRLLRAHHEHVVVAWNKRDRTNDDLYLLNIVTGAYEMIAENPGDVIAWMPDSSGRARARVRHLGPNERQLEVLRDGQWVVLQRLDLEEFNLSMLGMTPDDTGLWLLSNRSRDRVALVRVELATGVETVVHEDPRLDIEAVTMNARSPQPLAAFTYPDRQAIHFLDRALEADLARLRGLGAAAIFFLGFSDDEQQLTAEVHTEKGYETYLVDRRTKETRLLARSSILRFAESMGTTQAVTLTARDGVRLHGYLTRPPGFVTPGPMVLHVHGGHWARDYWTYDNVTQFLANRGYAVLRVNYRGSTGYGRAFRELAIGEYAGRMHDDLVDAVRWAVKAGLADPGRVAIYGGSYGGYAAMVGMTFTPEVFACGVAVVGISNWLTYYETTPPYWRHAVLPLLHKYVGDPSRPDDRRRLEAISPIFKVAQVKGPMLLLHGARDPRVNVRQSEQMASVLEQAGKTVRLVVFPDEGHTRQYGNWRNAVRHYTEVETFLAGCLGGDASIRASGGN